MALDFLNKGQNKSLRTFERIDNFQEMFKNSGLDWTVRAEKVFTETGLDTGCSANVRADTDTVLSVVSGKYNLIQNSEAFRLAESLVNSEGFVKGSANTGFFKGGKLTYIQLATPKFSVLDDSIQPYVFVLNSFDGASSFKVGVTNVRIICKNTLQTAVKNASRIWTVSHKKEWEQNELLDVAKTTLDFTSLYQDKFVKKAKELYDLKLDTTKFFKTLKEDLLKSMTEDGAETVVYRIKKIVEEKEDLQNFKNTGWGLYNAVADYVSNSIPLKLSNSFEEKRSVQSMVGFPLLTKTQAMLEDLV